MTTTNTTPNRGYQEPFGTNELAVDVARIIAALRAIDVDVQDIVATLTAKAPLASPALTGVPTAPTAVGGTDSTQVATTAYVMAAINALIGGAPGALDTLNEIAAALGDDEDFAAVVTTALALRLRVDAAQSLTTTQQAQGRSNLVAASVETGAQLGLLVNPFFEVSQENGTTLLTTSGAYPTDQWITNLNGTSTFTHQQVADPFSGTSGYRRLRHGVRLTITAAQASLGASNFAPCFQQAVEGVHWQPLGWGTADARAIVVVGIVNASVAGQYTLSIRNGDGTRSYVRVAILVAGINVFYETIPGDTSGTWVTDTSRGSIVSIGTGTGSAFQSPAADTWLTGNYFGVSGALNMAATNGATLTVGYLNVFPAGVLPWTSASEITGEALQHLLNMRRSYDDELRRCERYWKQKPYEYLSMITGQATRFIFRVPPGMRPGWALSLAHPDTGAANQVKEFSVGTARTVSLVNTYSGSESGYVQISTSATYDVSSTLTFSSRM